LLLNKIFFSLKAYLYLNLIWFFSRVGSLDFVIKKLSKGVSAFKLSDREALDCIEGVSWRMPWLNTCLYKALFVFGVLKKNRDDIFFKIGVRKNASLIQAHAWIENGSGEIVYTHEDTNAEDYLQILSL